MADIKTKDERSRNMSAIKGRNTKPELYLRKFLFSNGYRYRLYPSYIPGHPDIWMKKYNTAIFVHGCFWHRHPLCRYAYVPKSNQEFWNKKFQANIERDRVVRQELEKKGIRCLVVWECTLKAVQRMYGNPEELIVMITAFLNSGIKYQEL